tara:strand:+ start:205295 stop:206122 length:828 start_codon:yes stop_codon:yes gene_type:complete
MRPILIAFGRALMSQLHFRMLMLTVMPFLLSLAIWGFVLWLGLPPLLDRLHLFFTDAQGTAIGGGILSWVNGGAIEAVVVPLFAMWVLLPLMILTALIFVATTAMPAIAKHVGQRQYGDIEKRHGGSLLGSLWISSTTFCIFLFLWIVTLPLSVIPPLTFVIQPALWGWLTYKVMAYDALADYADVQERQTILRQRRWQLLAIGAIAGAMGAAPTLLWLGGALSVIFFPLLAGAAIWLYVLVFVFTGLWFQHFCMEELATMRIAEGAMNVRAIED